jgi:hypothetical protein
MFIKLRSAALLVWTLYALIATKTEINATKTYRAFDNALIEDAVFWLSDNIRFSPRY